MNVRFFLERTLEIRSSSPIDEAQGGESTWRIDTACSVVELRGFSQAIGQLQIVLDPQGGRRLFEQQLDLVHRRECLLSVDIKRRDAPPRSAFLEVVEVSRQQHGTRFCKIHEQNLVSRRVPGRGDDPDRSVGEDIVVTV